jgi:hypothetical protein
MSVETDTKQHKLEKSSKEERGPVAATSRRGLGMRVGTLNDWRAAGKKPGEDSARRNRYRDGR